MPPIGKKMAEGSKPPSVRPGIQLSIRASVGLPTHGLAPVLGGRSIHSRGSLLGGLTDVPSSNGFGTRSHTSWVTTRGLVAVPVPTVSRPGLASGHLPDGGGTFLTNRTDSRQPGSLCRRYLGGRSKKAARLDRDSSPQGEAFKS